MTTTTYDLGRPPAAAQRGGDCRARDLTKARNVLGGHRFATTTACRINNGIIRLTVGASGAAPSLTFEAWRGLVGIGDVFEDVFHDVYPGTLSGTAAWLPMGTLTIDSPSVSALLTAVRLVKVNSQVVIIRLVSPLIGDAFVALRQGWREVEIQHGDTRANPQVIVSRRIRWTASPSPVGTATSGRVEETSPAIEGLPRFVAAVDPAAANAGAFRLTATAVASAHFGAGAASTAFRDRPADQHGQLSDASLLEVDVSATAVVEFPDLFEDEF